MSRIPDDKMPDDKPFDDYLQRDSIVSQRYRDLDSDGVPPALDTAVLAQARVAISAPAKSMVRRRPAWLRWAPPLALAASAVMIVAIVLEVGVQHEVRAPVPQLEQATSQAIDASNQVGASGRIEAKVAQDMVERPLEALAPQASTLTTQPPPAPVAAPEPAHVPVPEVAFVLAPAPSASQVLAPAPHESVVQNGSASDAVHAAAERRESEEVIVTGNRRARQLYDSPASATSLEEIAVQSSAPSARARGGFGPRAPGAPLPSQVTSAKRTDTVSGETRKYSTAESWLEAIRKLRADGKNAEADEQWRLFKRDYPDFAVPNDDAAIPSTQRRAP
jgi:hypothetical protein